MHRSQLPRSGMALGGVGAGWFEIRQDGGFANWRIFNNEPLFTGPPYPYNPKQTLFFLLRVREENEDPRLLLLQIEDGHGAAAIGGHEYQYIFPWIEAVDRIRYAASFPFADLVFERDGLPLRIALRAWSPFIPGQVKDSALPLAYFDFSVEFTGHRPVELQLVATMRNAVGYDQPQRHHRNRRVRDGAFSAVVMEAGGLDPKASSSGSAALASLSEDSTAYLGWEHHHPFYERLLRESPMPEFDDTENRNKTDPQTGRPYAANANYVSIGRARRLATRSLP